MTAHILGDVAGQRHGHPVDDRLDRGGRSEAVGLRHDPGRQDAAARTAGDEQAVLVGIVLRDKFIDDAHQVIIVITRIIEVDQLGEVLAIAGRAARVRPHGHIAFGGIALDLAAEEGRIHRIRPAMDFEDQREASVSLEVRRQGDPGLDLAAVSAGGDLDLLHLRHVEIGQDVFVQRGAHRTILAVHADGCDFRRAVGEAGGVGDHRPAAFADGEAAFAIGAPDGGAADIGDHLADPAVQAHFVNGQHAMVFAQGQQALAVRRPGDAAEFQREVGGQFARIVAIGIHQVEIGLLIAFQVVVIAAIGDGLAVRRDDRAHVGPVAARQGADGIVGEFHLVDLALDRVHVAVFGEIAGDQQRVIVQPLRAAEIGLSERHLARRTAIDRQHEDLLGAVLEVTSPVEAEGEIVDHLDAGIPFRAFRRGQRLGEARCLALHEHGEGDGLAVRRPDRAGGAFIGELGQRIGAAGIEIEDAHLRLTVIRVHVENARPVRRPARGGSRAAAHQRAVRAAGQVDRPEAAGVLVGHPVHGVAHIDHRLAVRRDLRVGGVFHVEHALGREALRRRLVILGECRSGAHQRGHGSHRKQSLFHAETLPVEKEGVTASTH